MVDLSGTKLFPGGPSDYRKEIRFHIGVPAKYRWDPKNDYSYQGLKRDEALKTRSIPVYDRGKLVFGVEPGL